MLGLINKVLSLLRIFDLAHTSSFVCILFVALCPYVSMGIVACLGKLLAINNDWTDWALIIIMENIRKSLSCDDHWEWELNLVCIPLCAWVQILKQVQDPFQLLLAEWQDSVVLLNIHVSDSVYDDSLWLIIFIVCWIILTLHSSTASYKDCCIWCLWIC